MRHLIFAALLVTITACGPSFKAESFYAQESVRTGTSTPDREQPSTQTPAVAIVDAAKAALLSDSLTPVLLKMFKAFQDVTAIDYTKPTQTISSSQTVSCPGGGTLTAAATGTLNLNVNFVNPTGTVNNGTGTVTFTNCSLSSGVALNGTANIVALSANLSAVINGSAPSTFNITGNHNLIGNVNVTYQNQTQNCALTLADDLSSNGTFNFISKTATGTVTAHVTGTACNFAVNTTKTETF